MEVVEVKNKAHQKEFVNVVNSIYTNDKSYIRPLDKDIEHIFSPQENPFFNHGTAVRYILTDDKNKTIGRIAAFINEKKAYGFDQPTGGVGFFECIHDKKAAFTLFDKAVEWLKNKGMEAVDGPINFGENDSFWGLLVEGFSEPAYGMQYNPPYYKTLFEEYGFQTYFEQVTNRLDLKKPFPERFWKIAEWVGKKPDYKFKHFKWSKFDQFIDDFCEIYNEAWRFHENFTTMVPEKVKPIFLQAKPIAIEELLWFAYHNDEPIGFILLYPDVNQIFKHFNGKLNFFNKLRFVWLKHKKTMTRLRVVVLGVKPKFQKSGIESGLFYNLRTPVYKRDWFNEMELSWVGDFNPKMRTLQDSMGAEFSKRHITYRLIFDPSRRKNIRAGYIPTDTKQKAKMENKSNN